MQIKTILRYHYTPIRISELKETDCTDYEEKLELADTTDRNVKSYNQLGK